MLIDNLMNYIINYMKYIPSDNEPVFITFSGLCTNGNCWAMSHETKKKNKKSYTYYYLIKSNINYIVLHSLPWSIVIINNYKFN